MGLILVKKYARMIAWIVVGRVGGLSVLLTLGTTSGNVASQYPLEKVTVG